jgi:spore coat protein CotH
LEIPDGEYATGWWVGGRSTKALSTGSFTYRGEDPTEYTDDFRQVTAQGPRICNL